MEKKVFTENDWAIISKQHKPIEMFMNSKEYCILEGLMGKKIIKIGQNITVIDKIPTFSKFLSAFQELTKDIHAFRGFNTFEELLPGYRRSGKEIDEITALQLFEKHGSAYYSAKNPIEFLANAQHYGLPTRLIDFTTNPFIALFFSMYNPLEKGRLYYYIACAKFDNNLVLEELPVFNSTDIMNNNVYIGLGDEDQYYSYYKKISDINNKLIMFYEDSNINNIDLGLITNRINSVREKDISGKYLGVSAEKSRLNKSILFVEPCFTNERIKNQQGLFMYPYDDDIEKHKELLVNNLSIIAIHKSYRDDIINYLDRIGITEYKMMPDLASICHEIIRELKHNQ